MGDFRWYGSSCIYGILWEDSNLKSKLAHVNVFLNLINNTQTPSFPPLIGHPNCFISMGAVSMEMLQMLCTEIFGSKTPIQTSASSRINGILRGT